MSAGCSCRCAAVAAARVGQTGTQADRREALRQTLDMLSFVEGAWNRGRWLGGCDNGRKDGVLKESSGGWTLLWNSVETGIEELLNSRTYRFWVGGRRFRGGNLKKR